MAEKTVEKRVVCLYRVSTAGQMEKDDIPMQKQACREFCGRQPGWEIVREFSEKGVSGFKISAKDRDAMQDIQKMALKGEFDVLLVYMFDRLGRRDDETPFVVEWFVKQGIEVWSAMEGQQRFDSHVDKLLNYIRYWQASGESIKTSLRVKTRLEQLTQEGHYTGGRTFFGYRAVNKGRVNKRNKEVLDLEIDPDEAGIVRLIFQKYVFEGYGARRIFRYLKEQGIRGRNGAAISIQTISHILKNPVCTGIICNGESRSEVLPDLRIIDEAVFERAQEIMRGRAVQRKETPLTTRGRSLMVGNIFCGHCGSRLMLAASGRKYKQKDGTVRSKTYFHYKCYKAIETACDGQTTYSAPKTDSLIDQIIRIQLARIKETPPQALIEKQCDREQELAKARAGEFHDQYQQKQRDYQDLKVETLKVIRGISRLNVDLLNSMLDETAVQLKELEARMDAADMELRELASGAEQVRKEYAQLMDWATQYDNCTFEAKKMIAAQFIKAVHIRRDYEIDVEFNLPFDELQRLYLEPEGSAEKGTRADAILSFVEEAMQAK